MMLGDELVCNSHRSKAGYEGRGCAGCSCSG